MLLLLNHLAQDPSDKMVNVLATYIEHQITTDKQVMPEYFEFITQAYAANDESIQVAAVQMVAELSTINIELLKSCPFDFLGFLQNAI